MQGSDSDTSSVQSDGNVVQFLLQGADTKHQRVNLIEPAQLTLVDHRKLTAQIFDLGSQLFQFIHFLRRSYASSGEQRAVFPARPATTITRSPKPRNNQMEVAMSGARHSVPKCADVVSAWQMVTRPQDYITDPDYAENMRHAWLVLLRDRRMRLEAERAQTVISSTFPEDAA